MNRYDIERKVAAGEALTAEEGAYLLDLLTHRELQVLDLQDDLNTPVELIHVPLTVGANGCNVTVDGDDAEKEVT